MSNRLPTLIGLIGVLTSGGALADLPGQSILGRYGVTAQPLPAAPPGDPAEAASVRPRFAVQPEQPWGAVNLEQTQQPSATGNISVDRALQQAHERCLRLQEQLLRRNSGKISCDEGSPTPAIGTGFTR